MVTKVQKWGNSQGLRLARQILEDARLAVGDEVEVEVSGEQIIITKARAKFDLATLLAALPDDYEAQESDWAEPVGKETW